MSETSGPAGSSADSGPLAAAMRYFGSILRYFTALAGLAQTEAKEAAIVYVKVAVYLIMGLIFLIFGYVLFLLFFVFVLEFALGISWMWITLGLAILHAIMAGICAYMAREGLRSSVFVATAAELRRDMEAMGAVQPQTPASTSQFTR